MDKKLINDRSTTLGSISRAQIYAQMRSPAYKVSKAALNMLMVQYAQEYASDGFTFLAVSPGVSTPIFTFQLLLCAAC